MTLHAKALLQFFYGMLILQNRRGTHRESTSKQNVGHWEGKRHIFCLWFFDLYLEEEIFTEQVQ